jgi:all-trans-retinol 13,14-reductase
MVPIAVFDSTQVPSSLDAIVIGSGISGLSIARILSLSGKRVLVLEAHSQAGGGCHIFTLGGFEFNVGE